MPFADTNRSPIIKPLVGQVQGLGATGVAVIKFPPGATYLSWALQATIAGVAATRAQIEAMWTQVRLTVSGQEKFTLSGKQLLAIMDFYRVGSTADTGIFQIYFERLWMDGRVDQDGPGLGTLNESSVQLEITQTASTIDAVAAFGIIDPVAQELGAHIKMLRLTPTFASTGKFIFNDLYRDPADVLVALHLAVPVVANLTNIALVADEIRVVDAPPAVLNQLLLEGNPTRTIQSAKLFVHVDFCRRNYFSDAIKLDMRTLSLELTFANAAPNSFDIIQEVATVKPTQAGVKSA